MQKSKLKITRQWLEEQGACSTGVEWFFKQKSTSLSVLIKKALLQKQFNFANWGLVRLMTQQQQVQYACFSALQSLAAFEKVYPSDKRPHETIKAALNWVLNPTDENKSAARSAAWSAESAARSAWSAESAAESAARSAAWSAESAAWSAAWSAESAESAESAWKKLLLYGLKIVVKQLVIKSVDSFVTKYGCFK